MQGIMKEMGEKMIIKPFNGLLITLIGYNIIMMTLIRNHDSDQEYMNT